MEVLTADLANEVLEDEDVLSDELEDIGPELRGMLERTQEMAQQAIGRRRREILRESGAGVGRRVEGPGTYDGLSREELWAEMVRRGQGMEGSVSHRELEGMSDEDLRSALEDSVASEADSGGGS